MPQRKAFLMAGASLKWIDYIKRKNGSQWACVFWLILTPPAPSRPLDHQLIPIVSTSIATLPLVPSPCSSTVLLQDIITRLNHSINSRKRNRVPGLLLAKYLLKNKWLLVPKFKNNEAKTRKMTRAWVLEQDSSVLNPALSFTLCMTIASYSTPWRLIFL